MVGTGCTSGLVTCTGMAGGDVDAASEVGTSQRRPAPAGGLVRQLEKHLGRDVWAAAQDCEAHELAKVGARRVRRCAGDGTGVDRLVGSHASEVSIEGRGAATEVGKPESN